MSKKNELNSFERYKLLINARNFHYDNFNKWMTYFYVAIGALFVGYYTIKSSTETNHQLDEEIKILLLLGYFVSIFWYLSCKGYYYWNINFITLVNDCEANDLKLKPKKRVYYVFANKNTQNNYLNPISGANISTSKISILFSFTITVFWGILLTKEVLDQQLFCRFLISIVSTFILSLIIGKFLRSKITHFPDLNIKQEKEL